MNDIDLSCAVWRKSSRSNGQGGACVEVALSVPRIVAVRDSKDPNGPTLLMRPTVWRAFLTEVRLDTCTVN